MTGTARLRRGTLALTVVALLVSMPAEASRADEKDQSRIRSSVAISATGVIGLGAGEGHDTRLQRDTRVDKGQRLVRQDDLTGPASAGQRPQARAAGLAAVLEQAGHPERRGQILLRGPPSPSR